MISSYFPGGQHLIFWFNWGYRSKNKKGEEQTTWKKYIMQAEGVHFALLHFHVWDLMQTRGFSETAKIYSLAAVLYPLKK